MPKLLPNVRQQLIETARRQVAEQGYTNTTIRSVAGACGVGVGTVYNYFPSKDMLVVGFMLEDWKICKQAIHQGVTEAEDVKAALFCMHEILCSYKDKYQILFADENAGFIRLLQ